MMSRLGWFWMTGSGIAAHIFSAMLALAIMALLTLTIILLVRNIRAAAATNSAGGQSDIIPPINIASDPMKILDERFAKGEINEEEYMRKKEMLKKT